MDKTNDLILSSEEFAKVLGVTVRTVQALAEKGVLSRVGRGRFSVKKSVLEYCNFLRNKKSTHQDSPMQEAKLKLTLAQAEKAEIQNQVLTGKLIPIELLTSIIAEVSGQIAGALDTIPSKIKRKHPQTDNQMIDAIKYQIVKAMNSLTDIDDITEKIIDEYIASNPELEAD